MKTALTSLILLTLLSLSIFADYIPSITLEGHTGVVNSVSFSPDGGTLVSVGWKDDTIRLWDIATGREKHTLKHRADGGVAFSPDGHTLASGGSDGTVRLWDVDTGREIRTFIGGGSSVAFSSDGRTLASGSGNGIYLWDVATGREKHILRGVAYSVSFSPDGHTLAGGGSDGTVRLWDVATGREKHTLIGGGDKVAFSPDGRTLASRDSFGTFHLWDVATGREKHIFKHDRSYNRIVFSPDGRTLASVGWKDDTIRLWDVATGREKHTIEYMSSYVAFSPDGRTLASGGYDGTVRLWDVATGREKHTLIGNGSWVAFSPDGRTLASGSFDGTVRLWNLRVDTRVHITPDSVVSPAIGEQLSINVSITKGENIGGYQFTVTFDATALRYIEIVHSDYLPPGAFAPASGVTGVLFSHNRDAYPITFAAVSLAGTGNGDGTLATLTFEVIDVKESIIGLSEVILTDSAGARLSHLSYSGVVTDPQISPEDVNTDGVVNILDLVKVASRFNQRSDIEKEDVNKDGSVDIRDLILVAGAMDAEP